MKAKDYCQAFADKITNERNFENKFRHLLEDFFFEEGWCSKTNPKIKVEGFDSEHTYKDANIKHFIEDCVRWSKQEREGQDKRIGVKDE